MKKILNWLKSSSSDFVLFIILIVLVNIIGQNLYFRVDLTEPKSYSLSKASINIAKNLDEPLSIRVFFDNEVTFHRINNSTFTFFSYFIWTIFFTY